MMTGLRWHRVPWWLLGLAVLLSLAGIVFIRSATMNAEGFSGQDRKQLVFLAGAIVLACAVLAVPVVRIRAFAVPAYALSLLLLLGLFFFGARINGALRWYQFGPMTLQPAAFAKVGTILILAGYLRFRSRGNLRDGLLVPLLLAFVPIVLIVRQPDLGSALVFVPVMLAMSYAAGASGRQVLSLVFAGGLLFGVLFPFLHDYQRERILVWWHQGSLTELQLWTSAYQMVQSLIAIGAGGISGFGYGLGPQNRYDFLPYRSVDYIFSVVAEETGFVGAVAVLGGYLLLILGVLSVARRTRERFARLLMVGVGTHFATHAFVHVAVCTSLLPATGLPLPLFSAGGSSLLAAYASLGLVLNVAARSEPVLARDGFE